MYLSYHEEKLTAERRAEINELTKQFQSWKLWSENGKLIFPWK